MNNEDLLNIIYPPQWVANLLHLYISGAQNQNNNGIKSELVYFVIPILSIDLLREKLNHANNRSSIYSIFEPLMDDNRNCFINLPERIESFVEITNNGLILLGNEIELNYDKFITVSKTIKYKNLKGSNDSDFYKASYYLGLIFAKEDFKNVFLKLGVLPI